METVVGEKSLGQEIAAFLKRKPQHYDVVFSVGPDKVQVKALKIILMVVSPVFEKEFESSWESASMKVGKEIPLPDVDPTIFEMFINLINSDTWSLDSLNALNLSPNSLLSLFGLCRRFKITRRIKTLKDAVKYFISTFHIFKDTAEFLEISKANLEISFASEGIPMDENKIFECACRWASNQCALEGLEPTGGNYRKVLDSCLFEIHFPTMSIEEFTKVDLCEKNILYPDEKLAIYEYIRLDKREQAKYVKSHQLPFKTRPKRSLGCFVLSLPKQFKLTTRTNPSSSFVCNGWKCCRAFQVSHKISLYGLGFLGPIGEDTHIDVTVQIKRYVVERDTFFDSGTLVKKIFARKGKIFYILLDKPIILESRNVDRSWKNWYSIEFSLKGPNNVSQYKVENPKPESFQALESDVEFQLHSSWTGGNPLAELLFKKVPRFNN